MAVEDDCVEEGPLEPGCAEEVSEEVCEVWEEVWEVCEDDGWEEEVCVLD